MLHVNSFSFVACLMNMFTGDDKILFLHELLISEYHERNQNSFSS